MDERYLHLAGIERFLVYKQPLMQIKAKEGIDTTLIYNWQVPYEPWMNSARLVLHQQISGCRQESSLYTLVVSDRVEFEAPAVYQINPELSYLIPGKKAKKYQSQGTVYLDFQDEVDAKKSRNGQPPVHLNFPVGKSVILRDFGRNSEELQKIESVIYGVKNDTDMTITGLFIKGYASPEGTYATNERLSQARVIALKNYLKNEFGLEESLFRLSSIAEDWDGLVALVQASDIEYKDKILEIIATTEIMNRREGTLMRLAKGEPYRKMFREMFPKLRKVEFLLYYTIRDYTIEESKVVLAQKPEKLSELELFNLAQSYGKDSKEYINILTEVIPRYYPDDVAARVNASAVLIENGDLNAAKDLLENIENTAIRNHPAIQNNLGVIYLKSGDLNRSKILFEKSAASGNKEAIHNQKEVLAKPVTSGKR
ncbi:OmpA family protein [Dysgonomonas sp. HGC4]|uniref:OmpA family protein n=1 Tax=Dysgonomonas sp. HGC4 TaxID=1658009 RepID=UPI0012F82A15|nr:OmpA family protein [Dysgonomonas sp. HGC4]MBD8347787.1 OmpA family protein [Dysgonomonas sp. HGC4]